MHLAEFDALRVGIPPPYPASGWLALFPFQEFREFREFRGGEFV